MSSFILIVLSLAEFSCENQNLVVKISENPIVAFLGRGLYHIIQ